MKRVVLVITSMVVCGLATAAPAVAQSPPTLEGETLVALFSQCNNDPGSGATEVGAQCTNDPRPPTVEATCDENGTSTLNYDITASGPQLQGTFPVALDAASGPYNGSFREDGTVTIAPQDDPVVPIDPSAGPFASVITSSLGFNTGALLTWTARFEIDAPAQDATIVGRKTLTTTLPGYGVCSELNNEVRPGSPVPVPVTGWFYLADATLSYTATITTPDGVFRDYGTAVSDLREAFATYIDQGDAKLNADVGLLAEIFDSALPAPEPVSGENCKKGGYLDFGGFDFKNQGDCVSYFATGGTNPPAG